MQDRNSPVLRACALPVKMLRRWLLAGPQSVQLRQKEASLLGLPQRPSRKDPTERRMLSAFGEARRSLCEQTRAAPKGRLAPLYNAWPGLRSLIGPPEWVAEQDVSSRALRQARCALPAAREDAIDVNFARHRRLLSDLRMAPELYLRGGHPTEWAPVWISRGAQLVVADEYIRQGRVDVLERDLLRVLRFPVGHFVADALLLALHELDAPRAHAVARRVLATPTPPDWTELALADDPSAEALLRRRCERSDDPRLGALAALLARAGDAAGAELEAYLQPRDSVDGDDLEQVIDALSQRPRWQGALASIEAMILRKLSASTSGLAGDSAPRSYGLELWRGLLSACPPNEKNAAAMARHRPEGDEIDLAEVWASSRAALSSLLRERGLDELSYWARCLALSRLSPAEVFEIFSEGIEENEELQELMLLFTPPIEGGELELRPIDWDRRWLQLGLDRGLPRVVAGVLRREDRAAARMVIESFGSFKRSEQSWGVIRRFAELNLPERLDAIVASVRSLAGNTHTASWEAWIRPWSDGPALARLLPELRALPKDKRLRNYDHLIEILEDVSEGPYIRMDPRS